MAPSVVYASVLGAVLATAATSAPGPNAASEDFRSWLAST